MRRIVAVIGALALITALIPAAARASVPENQYRVIESRNASAAFFSTEGCYETQVWISSADGKFGGRPGPVGKQGLTSLDVVVYDTCGPWVGKHPPVVFEAFGQDLTVLGTTPRMDRAWVSTSYETLDEATGDPVTISFEMAWQLDGVMQHDTSHIHVAPSDQGVAMSHDNHWYGAAIASGSVSIDGVTTELAATTEATLEIVKAGCQVIPRPNQSSDLACY